MKKTFITLALIACAMMLVSCGNNGNKKSEAKEGYKIVDAPRAVYIDGIWNQEDPAKWLTIIQVPVEKA